MENSSTVSTDVTTKIDLHGQTATMIDPLDGIALARTGAHVHIIRAQGRETRQRQAGIAALRRVLSIGVGAVRRFVRRGWLCRITVRGHGNRDRTHRFGRRTVSRMFCRMGFMRRLALVRHFFSGRRLMLLVMGCRGRTVGFHLGLMVSLLRLVRMRSRMRRLFTCLMCGGGLTFMVMRRLIDHLSKADPYL